MANDIEQDRVFIQFKDGGEWIDCAELSANGWNIYEAASVEDTAQDYLVLDTDNYSGLMSHFHSGESFDFKKYAEIYEWLENSDVDTGAVNAFIENHGLSYLAQDVFENSYIGKFSSSKEFLQNHCSEDFENINPNWLDWDYIWKDYSQDFTEINGYYFNNV